MKATKKRKYRLLVVDDNRAIHEDFRKILDPDFGINELDSIEADLFGIKVQKPRRQDFSIDSAYQGEEGLELVRDAVKEGKPYSLAFIDMRMPPGWNGIETIQAIWEVDPEQQVVICSAYSDHSWAEISKRLNHSDRVLILKKPFDNIEILQMAYAMSHKCMLARQTKQSPQNNSGAPVDDAVLQPIKDKVTLLQDAFDGLKIKLDDMRNTLKETSAESPEQQLSKLRDHIESSDLDGKIPDALNQLQTTLERASKESAYAKETDKAVR